MTWNIIATIENLCHLDIKERLMFIRKLLCNPFKKPLDLLAGDAVFLFTLLTQSVRPSLVTCPSLH